MRRHANPEHGTASGAEWTSPRTPGLGDLKKKKEEDPIATCSSSSFLHSNEQNCSINCSSFLPLLIFLHHQLSSRALGPPPPHCGVPCVEARTSPVGHPVGPDEPRRARLISQLGAHDPRLPPVEPTADATAVGETAVDREKRCAVFAVSLELGFYKLNRNGAYPCLCDAWWLVLVKSR